MSLPRDEAEKYLSMEVAALQTPKAPDPETPEWWLLQAKSLGLSLLRTWKQNDLQSHTLADKHRQELRKRLGI